jgi:hypothetical protein
MDKEKMMDTGFYFSGGPARRLSRAETFARGFWQNNSTPEKFYNRSNLLVVRIIKF